MRDIRALIGGSSLPEKVKRTALDIFSKIAVAEGKVHGRPPDEVHFHEVGAVDSIVDIVAFALCLHTLSPDRVVCSPIREGHGFVRCQHGLIPVPAPATLELLKDCGAVLRPADAEGEMVTPTGAGILAAVASRFGEPLPAGTVVGTGYGAGAKDFPHPNVLRAVLVETDPRADADGETVLELCCNLDDCTGEELGYVTELLFKQGALDVCHTPIFMKKNRPATMLTVLAPPRLEDALCGLILRHTSTLGVRVTRTRRVTLERSFVTVSTPYGPVRVKRAQIDGLQKLAPEYESVREAAQTHGVTLREVSQAALTAYEGGLFRNDGR
jgi:uncharacterized protein (TIGR00299 family) protein